ncbi:MAG: hypothetical protein ABIG11_00955 [bacterium]
MTKKGQVLVIAVLLIAVLSVLIPAMVWWASNDTKASVKQKKSTTAFHLAEAGIDRAHWKLMERADIWVETGSTTLSGYNFDKAYYDIGGGTYTIKISSDPTDNTKRIVESIGMDSSNNELRKIRAVYSGSGAVDFAVRAERTGAVGANVDIHWGPVMSGFSLNVGTRKFPRYYSAGHVSDLDGGAVGANTDDVQWWSYYSIPPKPIVKTEVFLSSATDSGNAPNGCGNGASSTYYFDGNAVFSGCQDTSNTSYYITGDASFSPGGGSIQNFIRGNLIVMGNLNVTGDGGGVGTYDAVVPPNAWKEYGNYWVVTGFKGFKDKFDTGAPATYALAKSQNYVTPSTVTYHLDNVLVQGFVYVGGSQGLTGGGNAIFHGVMMSAVDTVMTTSGFSLYFDNTIAENIPLSGTIITLSSWDEISPVTWPAGL